MNAKNEILLAPKVFNLSRSRFSINLSMFNEILEKTGMIFNEIFYFFVDNLKLNW